MSVVSGLAVTPGNSVVESGGFLLVCAVCGLLGAFVMDLPMLNQDEGFTPAYVAASVLRRTSAEEIAFESAFVLHHATGIVAGAFYATVYAIVAAGVPDVVELGGVGAAPHVLATVLVSGVVYAVFAHLVLPRAGRRTYEERATAVRGQWLRSTVVFGVVIGVSVPAATMLL